jgi:peptidoglycan/LPS O-acetylase OafA/YrhL
VSNQILTEAASNEPNISPQSSPFLHLSALDSLRGLAALYVFFGHTVHQTNIDETQIPKLIRILFRSLDFGGYAVALFIVLSGFCLMLPILRNGGEIRGGIKMFFFRRARRILPPYYVTLLLSLVLINTLIGHPDSDLWNKNLPVTTHNIVTHLFLIHDLFKDDIAKINSPLWSIAVEWRIYFFFPFLVMAWKKWGGWKTTLTTLGVSYLLFSGLSLSPLFNSEPPGPSLHFFFLFAEGMLAAEIVFSETEWNRQLRKNIPWTLLASILLMLAVPASGIRYMRGISWILSDVLAGLSAMSILVAVLSFRNHPLNAILTWNPLVKIGCFSYSIYLIHMPLMQVFLQYVSHPLHLQPIFELVFILAIGVPSVILMSYLFFLSVEKPFLSQRAKQAL